MTNTLALLQPSLTEVMVWLTYLAVSAQNQHLRNNPFIHPLNKSCVFKAKSLHVVSFCALVCQYAAHPTWYQENNTFGAMSTYGYSREPPTLDLQEKSKSTMDGWKRVINKHAPFSCTHVGIFGGTRIKFGIEKVSRNLVYTVLRVKEGKEYCNKEYLGEGGR